MQPKHILFALALTGLFAACSQSQSRQTEATAEQATEAVNTVEVTYHVEGMSCDHCEQSIQKSVQELPGIQQVEANHEDSTTRVVFDSSKTDAKAIAEVIEGRGYTVSVNQ